MQRVQLVLDDRIMFVVYVRQYRIESEKRIPIEACLFWPTTMAHSTRAAPELSMQLSIVCLLALSAPPLFPFLFLFDWEKKKRKQTFS